MHGFGYATLATVQTACQVAMPLRNGDARGQGGGRESAMAAVHHGEASGDANCTRMVRELAFETSPEIGVRSGIRK